MYRLVKFPRIKVPRLIVSTPHISSQVCSSCGIVNLTPNLNLGVTNVLCSRNYRTNTHVLFTSQLFKKKRFRKEKKVFTELLEVFSNTSNQTKASVRNLKPKDVSRIAVSPNLELDSFHKIKKKQIRLKAEKIPVSVSKNALPETGENNSNWRSENLDWKMSTFQHLNVFVKEERNFSSETKLDNSVPNDLITVSSDLNKTNNEKFVEELQEEISNMHEETSDPQELLDGNGLHISSIDPHFKECIANGYELQHNSEMANEIFTRTASEISTTKSTEETKRKEMSNKKRVSKEKLAKGKMSDLEKKLKEKAFNTTLLAYLNLCVSCNFLQRGLTTLNLYIHRSKLSSKNPKITDVKIFEVLMRGFAEKGNQNKVNEILKCLMGLELKPSLDVFALCLESAARAHNKSQVRQIIGSLKDSGYHLNDIFTKCTFLKDQRDIILKAIEGVEPGFKPKLPFPSICYSCSLLQELNEKQGKNLELRSPVGQLVNKAQLQRFTEEQFNNELSSYLKVKSVEKRIEPEGSLEVNRQKLNSMRVSWEKNLKNGFERDVSVLEMFKKPTHLSLFPYMKVLDAQSYIDIMMQEVQRIAEGSETFSPTTYQLYRNLGHQVRNRYIIKFKKNNGIVDKTKILYDRYCDWYLNPSLNNHRSINGRQEWQQLLHENQNGPSLGGDEDYWPSTVLIGIGKFLYNIIIADVQIDVNILNKSTKEHMLPAFYRVYRHQGIKNVEEIKPHPVISKLFRAAAEEHITFDITLVPMLSPPLPWSSYKSGGYLTSKTDIIRLPDQAFQQRQRLKDAPPEQLYPPLDSLNQLGSIPWKINIPVLDTVIDVFNNGGCTKLDIPEPPHMAPVAEPVNPTMNKQERYQAYRQRMLLRRQKAEMYSLWCDALYKLSLANHFRDRIFWLPHNMDFRGRVYPCPPHLNHLGADMSRSLLCFAQGQPLGPNGLDWLKIHLVNLLGTKKRDSVAERLNYANNILADILDSAENPLTGGKWWMDSETPWQTLACCMDIRAALEHPEGPEQYVSHFPIHQDGSCNGLQHYAALGRDEAGACSVNLMPQELPQDVYSCVATMVERERAKDSAAGVKVAKELDGFVLRKVIKQTVMTTVYGVTRFGARLQIAKQLKDIDSFPKECVWPASTYLVVKTFESLREMFNSTKEIQDWFTECARLVSQIRGENMEYVTPLGLPVVQYYTRQMKKFDFTTNKLGHLHEYFPIDTFERPNVMKQKNAFPPNFIHSLDSSHMMLTSIFCEQRGMTFVSVHDCYWTHANTVHIMNQICREQFVALHSQPILEDLSAFMLKKYGYNEREKMDKQTSVCQAKQRLNFVLAKVPRKGTFLLENVLDSIYFFS